MATNIFVLRCKTGNGQHTIDSLSTESTLADLKGCLQKLTGISSDCIKILSGFPPKPLNMENDEMKLDYFNIRSGDTLIIGKKSPHAIPVEEGSPSTSTGKQAAGSVGQQFDRKSGQQAGVSGVQQASASKMQEVAGSSDQRFDRKSMQQASVSRVQQEGISRRQHADMVNGQSSGILMRYVVPSNNSCLFSSIYLITSGGDTDLEKSKDLRNIISSTVAADPIKFNEAFLGMPNNQYCTWIRNEENWGGAIELSILSDYYEVEIVTIDIQSLKLLHFGEIHGYDHRFFLIYDGIHYDPLVMESIDGNKITETFFHSSDFKTLAMAKEIAKEAKSSHQFTDLSNFTLRCFACQIYLRGNREATQHAIETNHCDFREV